MRRIGNLYQMSKIELRYEMCGGLLVKKTNKGRDSYIVNGLQTGNYNSVKSGLVGTKDKNWSYSYLSNEEMATYLETGVAPTGSYQSSGTPLFNSIDEVYKGTGRLLPYMKVSYQGNLLVQLNYHNNQ
jgi:hypothetical protein